MPATLAFILGVVQALTEFLPVSSSGHLVIFQYYLAPRFGAGPVPLSFDIAVHAATLLATLLFLRSDLFTLLQFGCSGVRGGRARRLLALMFVASIPAAVVGLALKDLIEQAFHSIQVAAFGFVVTTSILLFAHVKQVGRERARDTSLEVEWELPALRQAIIIGCFQALAIVPGISRSGSTVCGAILQGLSAETAIRFSFLISIPAIAGATLLELRNIASLDSSDAVSYFIGFLAAFAFGVVALHAFISLTRRAKLVYFAAYTSLLAIALCLIEALDLI